MGGGRYVVWGVGGFSSVKVFGGQKGFRNLGGDNIACRMRMVGGSTLALVIVLSMLFASCHCRPFSSALCAAATLSCAAWRAIVCVVLMFMVIVINVIVVIVGTIVVVHV